MSAPPDFGGSDFGGFVGDTELPPDPPQQRKSGGSMKMVTNPTFAGNMQGSTSSKDSNRNSRAGSSLVAMQPTLRRNAGRGQGLRGPHGGGVVYGVESSSELQTSGTSKNRKGLAGAQKDNNRGYRVIVRNGMSGGHIVEVRTEAQVNTALEALFKGGCCAPKNKQNNVAVGSTHDGYSTWTFSTKDIDWVQLNETVKQGAFAGVSNNPGCCCCCCCMVEDKDAGAHVSTDKTLDVHLRFGQVIKISWDDVQSARPSEKPQCCAPSTQRSFDTSEQTVDDGTTVTTIHSSEKTSPPTCPCIQCCFGFMRFEQSHKITHKYVMDDSYKDKCESEGEHLSSLANILMHLMVEDRDTRYEQVDRRFNSQVMS